MNVHVAKVIGVVVLLLGLLGGVVLLVKVQAPMEVVLTLGASVGAAFTGAIGWLTGKSNKGGQAAILLTAGAILAGEQGCSSPPKTASAAAEGAYGAALLKCVDDAKTLAESKACRARVDAEWGVTQTAKDGGR